LGRLYAGEQVSIGVLTESDCTNGHTYHSRSHERLKVEHLKRIRWLKSGKRRRRMIKQGEKTNHFIHHKFRVKVNVPGWVHLIVAGLWRNSYTARSSDGTWRCSTNTFKSNKSNEPEKKESATPPESPGPQQQGQVGAHDPSHRIDKPLFKEGMNGWRIIHG